MIGADKGTLLSLTGGVRLVQRVQRPKVHERLDRGTHCWYFRYRKDELLPDGTVKVARKFHTIGASRGAGALTKRQAEGERDRVLAELSNARTRTKAAVAANQPIEPGMIIFGKLAELWRRDYVEREVGGRPLVAVSTQSKYISHLETTFCRVGKRSVCAISGPRKSPTGSRLRANRGTRWMTSAT
jgi:hypothetical protein